MITSEKLAVYRKYAGDIDGWSRAGVQQDHVITDAEWWAITTLLQELSMYKRKLVSARYAKQIHDNLWKLLPTTKWRVNYSILHEAGSHAR